MSTDEPLRYEEQLFIALIPLVFPLSLVLFDNVFFFFLTDSLMFFLFQQEHAFESSQKYKEGKFIIELAHMIKDNGWE